MRQENQALSTTASTIAKRDLYEIIMIVNPGSTGITAYVNLRGGPATSADVPILSGGAPLTITLGPNDTGASIVAASATPTVILLRESFQSRADFLSFGPVFIVAAAALASYWVATSATQISAAGAFVTIGADNLTAKTANNVLTLVKNGTAGLILGNSGLALDNPADTLVGTSNTGIEFSSTQHVAKVGGTTKTLLASTELQAHNIGLILYNGAGTDPRISMLPSGTPRLTLNLPAAGGASSTTFLCVELPIKSGSVVAAGDMVCYDFSGQNRVRTATASTDHVKGKAVTGGTGNAGGTVTSIIIVGGVEVNAFTADTAGVTAGQYLIPGAVTATKVQSQATIPVAFAKALTTAALNALTDVQYNDSM